MSRQPAVTRRAVDPVGEGEVQAVAAAQGDGEASRRSSRSGHISTGTSSTASSVAMTTWAQISRHRYRLPSTAPISVKNGCALDPAEV
jgi:hypothetical protein